LRFPDSRLSACLGQSFARFLLALGREILDLQTLGLAALPIHVRVLFVCAAVAAPALARVQLCLGHGASFPSTLASYPGIDRLMQPWLRPLGFRRPLRQPSYQVRVHKGKVEVRGLPQTKVADSATWPRPICP
jgi:hypothetical protein